MSRLDRLQLMEANWISKNIEMSNYQMQKDSGMVFEQVVYLNSEKGKAGFQIWGSSDPLAFSHPTQDWICHLSV